MANPAHVPQATLRRRFGASTSAAITLLALGACSRPADAPQQQAQPPATAPSTAALLAKELPAEYKSWPQEAAVGACSIDPARLNSDGSIGLTGWGIINATSGEVPDNFILEIDKDGSRYYVTASGIDRQDVAAKLNNPALLRSGFTATLPPDSLKAPFTVTARLGFQKKFFPCEHKLVVQ